MSEEYEDKPSLYKALRGLISGEEFVNPYRFGETSFAQNPKKFIDRSDPNYQESIYAEPTELPSMDSGGMAGGVANVMKGPGWQSRTLDWLAGRIGKAPKSATIESWVSKLKGSGLPEAERKTLEPILNDFNPKDIVSGNELAFMAERVRGLPTLGIETRELSEANVNRYTKTYAKIRKLDKEIDEKAYNIAMGKGPVEDYDKLSNLRDRIRVIKDEVAYKAEAAEPKWKQYNLDEVKDKREVLYKQRGSTYTNSDIETHYPGGPGEGLQWHQREGKINFPEGQSTHLSEQQSDLMSEWVAAQRMKKDFGKLGDLPGDEARIPAPKLGDNWYKTGFRDLVNRAVREDSKFISWDSAAVQKQRWPAGEGTDKFFDTHYDQKLVNFVKKEYGVLPEKVNVGQGTGTNRKFFSADFEGPVPYRSVDVQTNPQTNRFRLVRRADNNEVTPIATREFDDYNEAWDFINSKSYIDGPPKEVWRIPITDDIKRKVLFEGQYFSKRKPEDEFSRPYDMA